jgi:excisionase family DNA binding protein
VVKVLVDSQDVYSLQEAAQALRIGIATLHRWLKAGKIIALRTGGRTYIPKSEVERLSKYKR